MNKDHEDQPRRAFVQSRADEYREIIGKCEDYAEEIEFAISMGKLIFAEVEENQEELEKVKLWLKKLEKRDIIDAPIKGVR